MEDWPKTLAKSYHANADQSAAWLAIIRGGKWVEMIIHTLISDQKWSNWITSSKETVRRLSGFILVHSRCEKSLISFVHMQHGYIPVSCWADVCAGGPGPERHEYSGAGVPAAGSRWPGRPPARSFGSALLRAGVNRSVYLHSLQPPLETPER